jgi:hypothetical protein
MLIDRENLVKRHNPKLTKVDFESPISIGNGNFAFTADVTGLQTLYSEYAAANAPLCTMSQWGWHTVPNHSGGKYTLADLQMTEYNINGKKYSYAVERKPGNEEVYDWLRHNPHKFNLAQISLSYDGKAINAADISDIWQELDLYSGVLYSNFTVSGKRFTVVTVCAKSADVIGFSINCPADCRFKVEISFPYASYKITGSDWENVGSHTTELIGNIICRGLDNDRYFVKIYGDNLFGHSTRHNFTTTLESGVIEFALGFFKNETDIQNTAAWSFEKITADADDGWRSYWQNGGAADFSICKDPRAFELERRIVLSQYLTAVHCAGSLPPQETGLMCNSWYGKFHLEMHLLHSAHFALWGRGELLEKSLGWYFEILDKAKANAARNGFKGARWPKMTSNEGWDSPSHIATLLIWQQPHLIYMLELLRSTKQDKARDAFTKEHWLLVKETADFMASFAQYNEKTDKYDLNMPLIPAQEEHKPEITKNPAFELSYWRFGLDTAVSWAKEMRQDCSDWALISENLACLPTAEGLYLAHENCPDTFGKFNRDHPSMLYGYGFIPNDDVKRDIISDTFNKVKQSWNFSSMWGWDFAFMAMTLAMLGRHEEAVDMLLMETSKNCFVSSGNNYQKGRSDLPLYLPGNGSLLFAVAVMLAAKGFPQDELWNVKFEGIKFSV